MLNVVDTAVAIIEQIVVGGVNCVNGPEFEAEVGIFLRHRFKRISVIVVPVPNGCGGNKFVCWFCEGDFVDILWVFAFLQQIIVPAGC